MVLKGDVTLTHLNSYIFMQNVCEKEKGLLVVVLKETMVKKKKKNPSTQKKTDEPSE